MQSTPYRYSFDFECFKFNKFNKPDTWVAPTMNARLHEPLSSSNTDAAAVWSAKEFHANLRPSYRTAFVSFELLG